MKKKKENKKGRKAKGKKNLMATVKGKDLPISTKKSIAICSYIKGKSPQKVLILLDKVTKKKIAIPMKGEIPHRHNMPKGKPSGRYPIKTCLYFIKLIKNLIANATIKNLDIESLIITKAIANKAATPYRGTRMAFNRKKFKRTHILLETIGIEKEIKKEKKKAEIKEKKVEKTPEQKEGKTEVKQKEKKLETKTESKPETKPESKKEEKKEEKQEEKTGKKEEEKKND